MGGLWGIGAAICALAAGFAILGPGIKGRLGSFFACAILAVILLTQVPHEQSSAAGSWVGGAFAAGLALGLVARVAEAFNRGATAWKQVKADHAAEALAALPTELLAEKLSIPVVVRYRDAKGEETRRGVTVERLLGLRPPGSSPVVVSYDGLCHLRNRRRSFRLDRTLDMANAETGEVLADPSFWLLTQAGQIEAPQPQAQGAPVPPTAPIVPTPRRRRFWRFLVLWLLIPPAMLLLMFGALLTVTALEDHETGLGIMFGLLTAGLAWLFWLIARRYGRRQPNVPAPENGGEAGGNN